MGGSFHSQVITFPPPKGGHQQTGGQRIQMEQRCKGTGGLVMDSASGTGSVDGVDGQEISKEVSSSVEVEIVGTSLCRRWMWLN